MAIPDICLYNLDSNSNNSPVLLLKNRGLTPQKLYKAEIWSDCTSKYVITMEKFPTSWDMGIRFKMADTALEQNVGICKSEPVEQPVVLKTKVSHFTNILCGYFCIGILFILFLRMFKPSQCGMLG